MTRTLVAVHDFLCEVSDLHRATGGACPTPRATHDCRTIGAGGAEEQERGPAEVGVGDVVPEVLAKDKSQRARVRQRDADAAIQQTGQGRVHPFRVVCRRQEGPRLRCPPRRLSRQGDYSLPGYPESRGRGWPSFGPESYPPGRQGESRGGRRFAAANVSLIASKKLPWWPPPPCQIELEPTTSGMCAPCVSQPTDARSGNPGLADDAGPVSHGGFRLQGITRPAIPTAIWSSGAAMML